MNMQKYAEFADRLARWHATSEYQIAAAEGERLGPLLRSGGVMCSDAYPSYQADQSGADPTWDGTFVVMFISGLDEQSACPDFDERVTEAWVAELLHGMFVVQGGFNVEATPPGNPPWFATRGFCLRPSAMQ